MRAAGVLGVLLAMVACNAAAIETRSLDASTQSVDAPSQPVDAESGPDAGTDAPLGAALDASLDAAGDVSSAITPIPDASGASGELGVGLDATDLDAPGPDPSPLPCDVDAGSDAGLCPLPHSVCADVDWLVYYDNGRCVAGQCIWEKRYVACTTLYCFAGGCQGPITAAQ